MTRPGAKARFICWAFRRAEALRSLPRKQRQEEAEGRSPPPMVFVPAFVDTALWSEVELRDQLRLTSGGGGGVDVHLAQIALDEGSNLLRNIRADVEGTTRRAPQ